MSELEAVRLVIWDLDETFWRGTITEGGIREYSDHNHNLVIELSRRGIINSICSKNDPEQVLPLLKKRGILEYFVFPSISWESKGHRIFGIVAATQLRPETVMFVDDNPNNRAEAIAILPNLQVEDETFVDRALDDLRFKGKADPELSRLKQYKLLEQKTADRTLHEHSNEEFLRGCGIRICIDYDVENGLDRAIELINRTNQLNFTKARLPEDIQEARIQLLDELRLFDRQAGLVRVVDKYGDYGYVGFFMTQSVAIKGDEGALKMRLCHFCFSCRTLGMLVEKWLYDYLGRPNINIVGHVLTDLTEEKNIDWIEVVPSIDDSQVASQKKISSQIVLVGGCEAHAIGVYLRAYSDKIKIVGNYASKGIFVRTNSAVMARQICTKELIEPLTMEARRLGLEAQMHAGDLFKTYCEDALYVFNLGIDYHDPHHYLVHKEYGWRFIIEPQGLSGHNFIMLSPDDLQNWLDSKSGFSSETRQHVVALSRYIRDNYFLELRPSDEYRLGEMRKLVDSVPYGARCIFIVDHDKQKGINGEIFDHWWVNDYKNALIEMSKARAYMGVVSFSDLVHGDSDVIFANHYGRAVYLRCATKIAELAMSLSPKEVDGRLKNAIIG